MTEYQVELTNVFEADSHEDAVIQFIGWALDNATTAGYRVFPYTNTGPGNSLFIDGEDVYA
jgi:hypothetical protein